MRTKRAMTATGTVPVAVDRCYALWLWLDARVTDFPVAARHGVGAAVLDTALAALDALVVASYAPPGSDRTAALHRANHRVALLRLLVRGARERHHLSIPQYEYAAEQLADLGRMIGGWLRHTRPPPGP